MPIHRPKDFWISASTGEDPDHGPAALRLKKLQAWYTSVVEDLYGPDHEVTRRSPGGRADWLHPGELEEPAADARREGDRCAAAGWHRD